MLKITALFALAFGFVAPVSFANAPASILGLWEVVSCNKPQAQADLDQAQSMGCNVLGQFAPNSQWQIGLHCQGQYHVVSEGTYSYNSQSGVITYGNNKSANKATAIGQWVMQIAELNDPQDFCTLERRQ